MKLRAIFGYLTIICILLAIFRRPILWSLGVEAEDWWHAFCGPWYWDMYLLGLEGYWPFTGDVREVDSSDKVYVEICFATFAVSCIIWIIAHVVGTLAACAGLYHVFFEE